jgi:signal transduction histidine kinase
VIAAQQSAWKNRHMTLSGTELFPLAVRADAVRLGQVVAHYLTNALKFSADAQPIEIAVRREPDGIRVSVRDYGPGLTPAQQTHLFERFYRVPGIEPQSRSAIGLGLGLFMCKTIIEAHHGQVGVESHAGQGSTFWFTLPCCA